MSPVFGKVMAPRRPHAPLPSQFIEAAMAILATRLVVCTLFSEMDERQSWLK